MTQAAQALFPSFSLFNLSSLRTRLWLFFSNFSDDWTLPFFFPDPGSQNLSFSQAVMCISPPSLRARAVSTRPAFSPGLVNSFQKKMNSDLGRTCLTRFGHGKMDALPDKIITLHNYVNSELITVRTLHSVSFSYVIFSVT